MLAKACIMAVMKPVIFIDGDQGTTGLRIHELLRARSDLELRTLPVDARKDPRLRRQALDECDIAILCLPDEAALEAAAWVANPRVRIIDASSAHRTHPAWVYGFAELEPAQPERIARAARVSNPGCYPTGVLALLRPLLDVGLIPADSPLAIHAVSGYSGRGRAGIDAFEARPGTLQVDGQDRRGPPMLQVYSLALDHKHVPEIMHYSGLRARPIFVPAYGAYRQGIVVTIGIDLNRLPKAPNAKALRDCLAERYANVPGIRVLSAAACAGLEAIDPCALNGSNDLELAVFGHSRHGHALLSAVFDNLGKGAAGAAVQNLELMLQG